MEKEEQEKEHEHEQDKDVNILELADIRITSTRENLKSCVKTARSILKDKLLSDYLNVNFPKKRFLG